MSTHTTTTTTPASATLKPPAVRVSLGGHLGNGKAMVLDASDWHDIAGTLGQNWGLNRAGDRLYVSTSRADALRGAAGIGTSGKVVFLARWIGAKIGEGAVSFRNGDSLDLRRSNLVTSRSGLPQASRDRAPVKVEPFVED